MNSIGSSEIFLDQSVKYAHSANRDKRLRKTSDFYKVRQRGNSLSDRLLVMSVMQNQLDVTRFGFSIGKRVGNSVLRNKVKRRLRDIVHNTSICKGWDVVVTVRSGSSDSNFKKLNGSFNYLSNRLNILGQ